MMKVQSDVPCTEKRRSVRAGHGIRESPLSERAVKAAGSYPLPYGKEAVCQNGNLGGNTESFRPMYRRGEKAFYFTNTYLLSKGDTKCLI